MNYYDILFAKKLAGEGGGSSVEVEPLSVTENGTYEEERKAFSPVTVNVGGGDGSIGELLYNDTITEWQSTESEQNFYYYQTSNFLEELPNPPAKIYVVWDDNLYSCPKYEDEVIWGAYDNGGFDFSVYPFSITIVSDPMEGTSSVEIDTSDDNTHTIQVYV